MSRPKSSAPHPTHVDMSDKMVVAISSRALFDLDESHKIYETQGLEAFHAYQTLHENDCLKPGPAFHIVKKLLAFNQNPKNQKLVEVLLLSRNTAESGLRVFNSIEHYGLDVTRAAFTGGHSPYHYAKAFKADLYLSLNQNDVQQALQAGLAAATLWSGSDQEDCDKELRIAFDGDAVLFSDESQRVYDEHGLHAFNQNEINARNSPLKEGPFKAFLQALVKLQKNEFVNIRTALVTARSAPAHARVINTLKDWDVRINEAFFLGGLEKGAFLNTFKADIFFDDQKNNCHSAHTHNVTAAHVPFGVSNEKKKVKESK